MKHAMAALGVLCVLALGACSSVEMPSAATRDPVVESAATDPTSTWDVYARLSTPWSALVSSPGLDAGSPQKSCSRPRGRYPSPSA